MHMLRISKITDYAVTSLVQLGYRSDSVTSAADLAAITGIPEPTMSKLLKMAAKRNLVTGSRGASGGYRLSRPTDKITMLDIITAFEGPISVTDCIEHGRHSCIIEHFCSLRHHWSVVNAAICESLQSVTLADMMRPVLIEKPLLQQREA